MTQLVTRIDDELAASLDRLVASGAVRNRSDAVRKGLERLIEEHRRKAVGDSIAEGYRREPQREAEIGWADESSIRMIADESW